MRALTKKKRDWIITVETDFMRSSLQTRIRDRVRRYLEKEEGVKCE